jgi:hypothetical protein
LWFCIANIEQNPLSRKFQMLNIVKDAARKGNFRVFKRKEPGTK